MTPSKRIVWLLIIAAVGTVILFILFQRPGKTVPGDGPPVKLTVGVTSTDPSSILFYIARDRGFFKAQGLDINLIEYSAGLLALGDLLQKRLDAASVSEFVTATQFFTHPELRIMASLARLDSHRVVARRDRGIAAPADLAGKRIAVTRNTSGDFFLATFLNQHGIHDGKVTIVDLPPPRMEDAIVTGKVDAVLTWGLQTETIGEHLGENAVYWPGQGGRGFYMLLLTRDDFLRHSTRTGDRLLAALVKAEEFIATRTPEVKRFMIERLGYGTGYLESLWTRADFRIRLDQDLLILMEDEAKWAILHKRQKGKMPNYLEAIHWEGMEKVRPEAVRIVH